jgi:hypothetical protein
MSPDELGIVAKLAGKGLRVSEQVDGVRSKELRDVLRRFELEARASRFTDSAVCSVTPISSAPSVQRRQAWKRCVECGRSTDRPRRGLCDRCRKAEDRARTG